MSDQRRLMSCYCRVNLCSFAGVGGLLAFGPSWETAVLKTTNIHSPNNPKKYMKLQLFEENQEENATFI